MEPLWDAIEAGRVEEVRRWFRERAERVEPNELRAVTARVLSTRHVPLLDWLLEETGFDVNAPFSIGNPLLFVLLQSSDPTLLEALLNRGADVHAVDRCGDPLLKNACHWGRVAAAAVLLNYGADPDQPDAEGRRPDDGLVPPFGSNRNRDWRAIVALLEDARASRGCGLK